MSATREGVENVRRAALADIVKNRTEILANELKEGGASAEDVASLAPAPEPSTDDPKRPEDVSIEEWAGLSDEDKAAHIKSAEGQPQGFRRKPNPRSRRSPRSSKRSGRHGANYEESPTCQATYGWSTPSAATCSRSAFRRSSARPSSPWRSSASSATRRTRRSRVRARARSTPGTCTRTSPRARHQALAETNTMPETNFTIIQGTLTITEAGNSVPFSQKLDNLSMHPVNTIIQKVLKNDAAKWFDAAAHTQFNRTPLRVVASAARTPRRSAHNQRDGDPDQQRRPAHRARAEHHLHDEGAQHSALHRGRLLRAGLADHVRHAAE
jgi:hypothetical protein